MAGRRTPDQRYADGTVQSTAFTPVKDSKLTGIAAGATANSSDATLLNRANHTGDQSADTITDGLANRLYTTDEKAKLAGITAGANAKVQIGGTQPSDPTVIWFRPA